METLQARREWQEIYQLMKSKGLQSRLLYPARLSIKMANFQDKERILMAAREKQDVTYKGAPIRLAADFSMETLQARKEW